jgi:hypothetical protein
MTHNHENVRKKPGRPTDPRTKEAIVRAIRGIGRPCKPSAIHSRLGTHEYTFVEVSTVRAYLHRMAGRANGPIVQLAGGKYAIRGWQVQSVSAWLMGELGGLEIDSGAPITRLRESYHQTFGNAAPVSELHRLIDRLFNDGVITDCRYRGWRLTSEARALLT